MISKLTGRIDRTEVDGGQDMLVLIVANRSNPQAVDASASLALYLATSGIDHVMTDSFELNSPAELLERHHLTDKEIDLAVVLGGDGTILRTARLLAGRATPILGINFGHLGFLANASDKGVIPLVAAAFSGELKAERRENLSIEVTLGEDLSEEDRKLRDAFLGEEFGINAQGLAGQTEFFALNEIAITRGPMGRTFSFSIDISATHIADLDGDGLIVASATGSTGYALAAGGPLVAPSYEGLVVQPLAPHSLKARAIVTDASDVVCVDLKNERSSRAATLFADGDILMFNQHVDRVLVRRGDVPTTLLYDEQEHFYRYAATTFFGKDA